MPPIKQSDAAIPGSASQPRRRIAIRRKLLAWYDANRRDLPWRNTRDPYAIWLSETMLQQTQVATVLPYYDRFLRKYPTVEELAAAPLDDVLRLWAGLGYYSRARHLHRAAIEITNRYNGRLPESAQSLRTLPGVGRYTAGAVASIAFDAHEAVVDGNVSRVLARLFEIDKDIKSTEGAATIWACAEELLPRRRPGDFNQSLMELGAVVCRPGDAAQCRTCPLRRECAALKSDRVTQLPMRSKKTLVKKETHVALVLERADKRLFRQRPAEGLWGGLWELPSTVHNTKSTFLSAQKIANELLGSAETVERRPICEVSHQLTHRMIRIVAYRAKATPRLAMTCRSMPTRWLSQASSDRVGISTAMRKLIAAIPGTLPP